MTLTPAQLQQFHDDGVLVVENVVTDADLAPVVAEYEAWIHDRARTLHAEGTLPDIAEDADFLHRFAILHAQNKHIADGMDIMHLRGRAMFEFLRNPNYLDTVQSLLQTPEITCNPIQHLRAKPPASSAGTGNNFYNVPWHQDIAVTWEEADNSDIVTCWTALVDATVENGCMEVLPGVHKLGLLTHQPGDGGANIRPDAIPDSAKPVAVPVKQGGVVFMHRCTPHRSTPNFSDAVRWSLDLRYQPAGQPTGRPFHPDFVARSVANPDSVLTDYDVWAERWKTALESSKGMRTHRV